VGPGVDRFEAIACRPRGHLRPDTDSLPATSVAEVPDPTPPIGMDRKLLWPPLPPMVA